MPPQSAASLRTPRWLPASVSGTPERVRARPEVPLQIRLRPDIPPRAHPLLEAAHPRLLSAGLRPQQQPAVQRGHVQRHAPGVGLRQGHDLGQRYCPHVLPRYEISMK